MGREHETTSTQGALYLAAGAVVGITAGVLLVQHYGGFGALASRVRDRWRRDERDDHLTGNDAHDYDDDEYVDEADEFAVDATLSDAEELEERVLEAYRNDPTLSERAIDIGAIDAGIIELTGWVHSAEEAHHAVTIARGTVGVQTVVNRLAVRTQEDWLDGHAKRYASGDASLAEGQWDGAVGSVNPEDDELPPAPRAD